MMTPHGPEGRDAALNNVPAAWWQDKKLVADRLGNALLISLTSAADIRRVVGLYQPRASSDPVQLKVAASKRDGASVRTIKLEDALDSTKWRLLPHFFDTEFKKQGDTAQAIDTEEFSGAITGIQAVLTMAGQPAGEPRVYPVLPFLSAWAPEEEQTVEPAPEERAGGYPCMYQILIQHINI